MEIIEVIKFLGYTSLVIIPAIAILTKSSLSLRNVIKESLDDGKIDQDEMDRILKESGVFVKQIAKFLMLFS